MRLFFFILFSLVSTFLNGQIVPNSSRATLSNKSYFPTQAVPTDFRSQYYDSVNFIMRDYRSIEEVDTYLNLPKYRAGKFPVYIHVGGVLNIDGTYTGGVTQTWCYQDGVNLTRVAESKQLEFNSYASMRSIPEELLDTANVYYYLSGRYLIQYYYDPNDSVSLDDSATCIVTETEARLMLMATDYVMPYIWGAFPDDNIEDQPAIQKMINWLVFNNLNIHKAVFEGGVYNFYTKGILIWKDTNGDGDPEQVQVSLIGAKSVATGGGGGETQFYATFTDGFVIGIQKGKGCEVSNIIGSGTNQLNYGLDSSWNKNATFLVNGHRNNKYSPSVFLALDPFGLVPDSLTDRYPQWNNYYRNIVGNGGSTICIFKNLKIDGFAVGVAHSTNVSTQNNEGHWYENIWFTNVRIGFVTTQSQERTVQVKNSYFWSSIYTCFDTRTYGQGRGEPPSIDGCNVAGGVYQFCFFSGTGGFFPEINVTNLYAELLWRLGYSLASTVFINANVSYGDPTDYYDFYPAAFRNLRFPDTLYYSPQTVFLNCKLVYYNGGVKLPTNYVGDMQFIGGVMQQQPGVKGDASSEEPREIDMDNAGFYAMIKAGFVNNKNLRWFTGNYRFFLSSTNYYMKYGQKVATWINPTGPFDNTFSAVQEREAASPLYKRAFIGDAVSLTVSGDSATATIALLDGKTYLEGSIIYCSETLSGQVMRIRRITGTTVCFDKLTESISTGSYNGLYIEDMQTVQLPIIADLSGGTTLSNVRQEYTTTPYTIPIGMYYMDGQRFFVTASSPGTATVTGTYVSSYDRAIISPTSWKESGYSVSNPLENSSYSDGMVFIKGGIYYNRSPAGTAGVYAWECTKSGMKGDATIPPEFKIVYNENAALYGVSVTSSRAAVISDLDKVVSIDNTSGSINYTVNPTTFADKKLIIKATIPGVNTITITPTSGNIDGAPNYSMAPGQVVTIWASGGNLYIITSYVPGGS